MMAAVKVLQLSKFYPPVEGGIEAVTREIAEGLAARRVDCDVLCAHTGRGTVEETVAHGVRVTRASSWGQALRTSLAPQMLRLLAARHAAYDLIHVHMPDPLAALALWRVRPRARIVLHWHSDVLRQRLARHAYGPLERWLLQRADAVVATSRAYAEASPELRRHREKVEVIPIGIGAPPPAPVAARVAALRARVGGRRIVFALGRMTHYKGFEVLVQAARSLPDDVVVLIGGGGERLEALRAGVAAAGLQGRVVLPGRLAAEAVEEAFAACELFCLPSVSRAEAYGVAVLEAMARGRACVTSDIPGSAIGWLNRHGETGLTVPVGDAVALAGALNRLLADDALRQRCSAAARQRWAEGFTAPTMIDATVALYRRLLADAAPVPAAAFDP